MKKSFVFLIAYLFVVNAVIADKIVTISGNSYEGKILSISDHGLEIETEDSFIELDRDKIESITKSDGTIVYSKPVIEQTPVKKIVEKTIPNDNNYGAVEKPDEAQPEKMDDDIHGQQTVKSPVPAIRDASKLCKLPFHYLPIFGDYFFTPTNQMMMQNRWYKCPVTVSLYGVPDLYKEKVKEAIDKWAEYMPVKLVETQDADIVFKWVPGSEIKKVTTSKTAVGVASHEFVNTHICTIYILSQKKYPETQLEHTLLHELGHAFGLGHSKNKKDLMHPINTAMKGGITDLLFTNISFVPIIIPTGFRKATKATLMISPADTNTLWKIYNQKNQSWR